jgi:hypothetical protein
MMRFAAAARFDRVHVTRVHGKFARPCGLRIGSRARLYRAAAAIIDVRPLRRAGAETLGAGHADLFRHHFNETAGRTSEADFP